MPAGLSMGQAHVSAATPGAQACCIGPNLALWRVAITAYLKQTTQVSNRWLCEQLAMGTPVAVSQLVGLARRQNGPAVELLRELTENIKT